MSAGFALINKAGGGHFHTSLHTHPLFPWELRNGIAKGNVHFKGFLIHQCQISFLQGSFNLPFHHLLHPHLICSTQKYKVSEIVGKARRLALFLLWVMFKKRAVCDLRCSDSLGSFRSPREDLSVQMSAKPSGQDGKGLIKS